MITDIPISNIFVPRNTWALNKCKKRKRLLTATTNYRKLRMIIDHVLNTTGIAEDSFMSKTRYRPVVEARQMYFKRAKDMTNATLAEIGSMVKSGDHANVMHGINQINTVPTLIKKYNELFN